MLRRDLAKVGYQLHKSHARNLSLDNLLGYMLVEPYSNTVVRGSRYELTLDDVADFVNED